MVSRVFSFATLFLFALALFAAPAVSIAQAPPQGQGQQQQMSEEQMKQLMEQMQRQQQQRPMPTPLEGGSSYTDETFGYTLDIPEGWNGQSVQRMVMAINGTPGQMQPGVDAEAFTAFVRPNSEFDMYFGDNVNRELDIEEFREQVKASVPDTKALDNIEIVDVERTTISDHPAIHITQRVRPDGTNWLMSEIYMAPYGKNYFHIMYTAPEDMRDSYTAVIDDHINSISLPAQ